MPCLRCGRNIKRPLSLICDHLICYPCGSLILELETLNERQKKYRLRCPKCKKLTYTYDLDNLVVREANFGIRIRSQESFEDFQNKGKMHSRKSSNIDAPCPLVTLCDEEEGESSKIIVPGRLDKEKLMERIQHSKLKLEEEYSAISQAITDQFYQFNRVLTKHRQSLLSELDSIYCYQIECLKTYSLSLSEKYSYVSPLQLARVQKTVSEIQSQRRKLQKTTQQAIDMFLRSNIFIVSVAEKEDGVAKEKESGCEQYRMSAPFRPRQNQMFAIDRKGGFEKGRTRGEKEKHRGEYGI